MTMKAVSRTFTPNDAGGYDFGGIYYPSATASITNSGVEAEATFVTFDENPIVQYAQTLSFVSVTFTVTLWNADIFQNQPITIRAIPFVSQEQEDLIESNRTDPTGNGTDYDSYSVYGIGAYNFLTLQYDGVGRGTVGVKNESVTTSVDATGLAGSNGGYDLAFAFHVGSYPQTGAIGYAGLTRATNAFITVTGITYVDLPIIANTAADQPVLDDLTITPFAGVTLSDPSNPAGFGDVITIRIQSGPGLTTGTLGTLSLPGNTSALRDKGDGTYTLDTASTATLQAELQALVFSPFSIGGTSGYEQATFEISYASYAGTQGTTTDATTTVRIRHDQRTITLDGSATGADDKPFQALKNFAIVDPYAGDQVGVTINVQAGTGTLSGDGLTQNANGTYSLAATSVSALNTQLDRLLFTATPGRAVAGAISTAEIGIVAYSADGWSGSAAESVKIKAVATAPTITGSAALQIKAKDTVRPFARAVVSDNNLNSTDTLKIQLSDSGRGGVLSGAGLSGGSGGNYILSGTAAAVTTALQALVFTPATGTPNGSVTTTFSLKDSTTPGTFVVNNSFSVTTDTPAVDPVITGTATLTVQGEAASTPFASTTLTDANAGSTGTLTIMLSNNGRNGVLSGAGLSVGGGGTYTLSGTAADVTAALQALVFTPTAGVPGTSTMTTFKLIDKSTSGTQTSNAAFTVTNTDAAVAPTLTGGAALAVRSEAASTPFASAALTDPNFNSTDVLTIQLSNAGKGGVLSGAGLSGGAGGTYTLSGTAATVTAALQALVFTPAKGAAGTTATTTFTLSDTTTFGTGATNSGFSVTNTDPLMATGAVFNPGPVSNTTIDATSAGPHTVIVGAGAQNTILYGSGAGTVTGSGTGNTVTGGNGAISVSGLGGATVIQLGDGNNTVNLAAAGANNAVVVGNGNNRIAAGNGGGEQVTAGNGANVISAGGANDVVQAGNGNNTVTMTGAAARVTTGSGNDIITITGAGGAMIRAGLGTNKISFAGTGNLIVNQGGNDMLTDNGSGNTIVLPLAGAGLVTIGANALMNGDVFDLRAAMAATGWDHQSGTLGSYLSTGMQGNDATIVIDPSGMVGGASYTVAVITAAGPTSLSSLLPHTLT